MSGLDSYDSVCGTRAIQYKHNVGYYTMLIRFGGGGMGLWLKS